MPLNFVLTIIATLNFTQTSSLLRTNQLGSSSLAVQLVTVFTNFLLRLALSLLPPFLVNVLLFLSAIDDLVTPPWFLSLAC